MTELASGNVSDRPWGLTLGALAIRGFTGTLKLTSDAQWFRMTFEHGALTDARSSLLSDSIARIAMSSNLLTRPQVERLVQQLAATPDRDEIAVVAELADLSGAQADALRRRAIAHRAARTFSIDRGEVVVTELAPKGAPLALDIRPVIYLGALVNMEDQRLERELAGLGERFQLVPNARDELPAYGFTEPDLKIAMALETPSSIANLDRGDGDRHAICAIVYTLVSGLAAAPVAEPIALGRSRTGRIEKLEPAGSFQITVRSPGAAKPPPEPTIGIRFGKPSAPPSAFDDIELGDKNSPAAPARPSRRPPSLGESPFDDMELEEPSAVHVVAPADLDRWSAEMASVVADDLEESTTVDAAERASQQSARRTAAMWAAAPFDDEPPKEPVPEPASAPSRRAHSRTAQLLVFAATPREPAPPAAEPKPIELDQPRMRRRTVSWLPMAARKKPDPK